MINRLRRDLSTRGVDSIEMGSVFADRHLTEASKHDAAEGSGPSSLTPLAHLLDDGTAGAGASVEKTTAHLGTDGEHIKLMVPIVSNEA